MSRRPKPEPKPAAPAAPMTDAAAMTGPQHEPASPPDTPIPGAEGQDAQKPESTLGDGDATGAAEEAPSATAAPKAPAPDVVKPAAAQTGGAKGHVIRVVGPAKGRWRAGRHFTPEPVEIAASELDEIDMQRLFDDPELICAVVGEA